MPSSGTDVDPSNMTYQARWGIPLLPSKSVTLVNGTYQVGYSDDWTYVDSVATGRVGSDVVKVASVGRRNAALGFELLLMLRVRAGHLQVAWIPTWSPDNPYPSTLRIGGALLSAAWPSCQYIVNCTSNPAITKKFALADNQVRVVA